MASLPYLDQNAPFTAESVQVLDKLVSAMGSSQPNERNYAVQALKEIKETHNLWIHVDTIIENAKNSDTKFFALSILDHVISTAWNAVPSDQKAGIKNYIIKLVIENTSSQVSTHFLNKLNLVLVQIVKREWTTTWRSFIPEICSASKSSQPLCENTLNILKLLSEEIFSDVGNMSSNKKNELKVTMNEEFSKIYELCDWVLKTAAMHPGAVQTSLIKSCLSTLVAFLEWVPPAHIYLGDFLKLIVDNYLDNPLFRSQALECLTEVAGVTMDLPETDSYFPMYHSAVLSLLVSSISKLSIHFPYATVDFSALHLNSDSNTQLALKSFCQHLSLFFLSYIEKHLQLIEKTVQASNGIETEQVVIQALTGLFAYMLSLTKHPEEEIFKICCDFWNTLAKHLYDQKGLNWLGNKLWNSIYRDVISEAKALLIPRMAKPTEILVSVDEYGNTVRETFQNTETVALYELMRETLVYLTHLDPEDTEHIIMLKMAKQMDGSEWSWQKVSSLAYAIGSIAGSMSENHEKRFLIHVIKDLLTLCESKRGKENKAVVATNIMYVVMQHPRFLVNHWNFLKTVVKKLFEFMHETHFGIKDMSVDTFLRISQNCGGEFIRIHEADDQREPFIFEIARSLGVTISDLENHQKLVVYQALGQILSCLSSEQELIYHISGCLKLVQDQWDRLLSSISANVQVLAELEVSRSLAYCIKANDSFCQTLGHSYYIQLQKIFSSLMQLYTAYSQLISSQISQRGVIIISHTHIVSARAVKKRILNLLCTYAKVCKNPKFLIDNFMTSILNIILTDFVNSIPELREAEVINLFADLTNSLNKGILPYMEIILGPFLDSVLTMLVQDFTTFPEHRSSFFEFLKAVTAHCFEALLQLPLERFKIAIDTVLWASKHQSTSHAELGLITLIQLLENVQAADTAGYFYQNFYIYILTEILAIATDSSHLSNFKHHIIILRHLFLIIESSTVSVPLADGISSPQENKNYVMNQLTQILVSNFTNMNRVQIETFIIGMFNRCSNQQEFKITFRDFLVTSKEIAVDNVAFYAEEREKEIQEARNKKAMVPGLLPNNY
jgi:exportin-1